MGKSVRSRVVIPVAVLLGIVLLLLALMIRWQESPSEVAKDARAKAGSSVGTAVPSQDSPTGEAWQRPSSGDSKAYAIAFGRAIWTYDTNAHDLYDWQDAVSAFADPMGDGPRIAKSMLPYFAQWEQLKLHHAKATVADVTAVVTPELLALEQSSKAPKGWHGYLVRGKQTSILDGQTTIVERQVTVGVVCLETCTFWSATTESPA